MKRSLSRSPMGLLTYVRSLLKARDGVSAIEFALIFPLIVALLAGTVDFGQALMADRKINQVVATATNLIALKSLWTTSDVDKIMAGTASILQPFNTSNLTLVVGVVTIDTSNNAKVVWSRAYNTTNWTVGAVSPVPVSSTVVEKGVQMVVAKATFSLSTPFATLLQPITGRTSYTYTRVSMNRPRITDSVTLN
jgi:Flp pilus assembly protein TadG